MLSSGVWCIVNVSQIIRRVVGSMMVCGDDGNTLHRTDRPYMPPRTQRSELEGLSEAQLRSKYQEVIGSPPPRGPFVVPALLISTILAHKPGATSKPSTTPAAPSPAVVYVH